MNLLSRLRLTKKGERYVGAQKLHRMQQQHDDARLMCAVEGRAMKVAEMGTNANHAGEQRDVVEIEDDGTVWYRKPGEIGEHYDSSKQWVVWKTGVDDDER